MLRIENIEKINDSKERFKLSIKASVTRGDWSMSTSDQWFVIRSSEDLKTYCNLLASCNVGFNGDEEMIAFDQSKMGDDFCEKLMGSINQAIEKAFDIFLASPDLLGFFEEHPFKSKFLLQLVSGLMCQVQQLKDKMFLQNQKFSESFEQLMNQSKDFSSRLESFEKSVLPNRANSEKHAPDYLPTSFGSVTAPVPSEPPSGQSTPRSSINPPYGSTMIQRPLSLDAGFNQTNVSTFPPPPPGISTGNGTLFNNVESFSVGKHTSILVAEQSALEAHDQFANVAEMSGKMVGTELNHPVPMDGEATLQLLNSKSLAKELFPTDEMCVQYDTPIEEIIIEPIQPHEAQLQYRASVIGLVRRCARKGLSSNTFEIGLHALNCFLPDDPVQLSVAVSRSYISDWHKSLIERLNKVAERSANGQEIDADDENSSGYRPLVPHILSNINFSLKEIHYKVYCNIDSLEVEVIANGRAELCMLAFLDEISRLVGQDYLFIRSVLLIRAWWCYETATYVGTPIKHYLSETCLCVMICAIFNQYFQIIHSPFQALCLFLAEYSDYDGTTSAISLQGTLPFKSENSSQVILKSPQPHHLISNELIEKYRQAFLVGQPSDDPQDESFRHLASSSSEDAMGMAEANEGNVPVTDGLEIHGQEGMSVPAPAVQTKTTAKLFDRFGFNIVHPFSQVNMITEKLHVRRLARISKAFQIGAANLTVVLKQPPANITSAILGYFPCVTARFGDNWRPDSIGNTVQVPFGARPRNARSLMNASVEKILQEIQYFDLMIESIISETALVTITSELLVDRGPLPVGEIGKILTELSSNPSLSQRLKELFGGLKKFLEKFSDKFIIINDHPYNPHVILRSTLSAQHIDMLERGILPGHLANKIKKQGQQLLQSQPAINNTNLLPQHPPTYGMNSTQNYLAQNAALKKKPMPVNGADPYLMQSGNRYPPQEVSNVGGALGVGTSYMGNANGSQMGQGMGMKQLSVVPPQVPPLQLKGMPPTQGKPVMNSNAPPFVSAQNYPYGQQIPPQSMNRGNLGSMNLNPDGSVISSNNLATIAGLLNHATANATSKYGTGPTTLLKQQQQHQLQQQQQQQQLARQQQYQQQQQQQFQNGQYPPVANSFNGNLKIMPNNQPYKNPQEFDLNGPGVLSQQQKFFPSQNTGQSGKSFPPQQQQQQQQQLYMNSRNPVSQGPGGMMSLQTGNYGAPNMGPGSSQIPRDRDVSMMQPKGGRPMLGGLPVRSATIQGCGGASQQLARLSGLMTSPNNGMPNVLGDDYFLPLDSPFHGLGNELGGSGNPNLQSDSQSVSARLSELLGGSSNPPGNVNQFQNEGSVNNTFAGPSNGLPSNLLSQSYFSTNEINHPNGEAPSDLFTNDYDNGTGDYDSSEKTKTGSFYTSSGASGGGSSKNLQSALFSQFAARDPDGGTVPSATPGFGFSQISQNFESMQGFNLPDQEMNSTEMRFGDTVDDKHNDITFGEYLK